MNRRVGLFGYDPSNLHSAARALAATGGRVILTGDTRELKGCDALVMPGVRAYAAYMAGLWAVGGMGLLMDWLPTGKPLLGICVGYQILLEESAGRDICTVGLDLQSGTVRSLAARRLLHMGWNRIDAPPGNRLFAGVKNERFYFVHSYVTTRTPGTDGTLVTTATHEAPFMVTVERGNVCSTQFHPEKSGEAGTRLLRNWLNPRNPQDANWSTS